MPSPKNSKYFIEVKVIDEIVKAITKSFDLDEVGQSIVDSIVKYLHSPGGTLLLVDNERDVLYAHSTSNTPVIRKVLNMLKKSFRQHVFHYKKESLTLLGRTVSESKAFQSPFFEDFLSPEISHFLAHVIQKLARVKMSVSLPVIFEKKVLGVLFISFYEKEISEERMAELSIFADHAAIAINNASKYKELQEKYKELNKRFEMEKEAISVLNHELKTPLAIAINAAYNLQATLNSGENESSLKSCIPKIKISTGNIVDALNRMHEISNSVLTLREVESRQLTVIHQLDIKQQVLPLLDNFKRIAEKKGITFQYSFDLQEGVFYGGGAQFSQLISILLDNAVKYTQTGGVSVTIKLSYPTLSCNVIDTGMGVPKNRQDIIFRRFYRHQDAKNINGLGLGLYIAKKIVQHVGGSINIAQNPQGKGSCFSVEIPIYKTPQGGVKI